MSIFRNFKNNNYLVSGILDNSLCRLGLFQLGLEMQSCLVQFPYMAQFIFSKPLTFFHLDTFIQFPKT